MKRILILGATGMIGYTLYRYLKETGKYEVFGTIREYPDNNIDLFTNEYIIDGFDIIDSEVELEYPFWYFEPNIVINCIGITKQIDSSIPDMIEVNALFPHKLANICSRYNARLIHLSTVCV